MSAQKIRDMLQSAIEEAQKASKESVSSDGRKYWSGVLHSLTAALKVLES